MQRGALSIAFLTAALTAGAVQAGNYDEKNINGYLDPIAARHQSESQKKGLEIYTHQYLIDEGWTSTEARMEMTLVDAQGRTSKRLVIKKMMEEAGVPDKTIGIFVEPNDIKGTVMLTFEQSEGADNQWLFMPTIKRTKKINAQNKSGSFVGSEFSWEDISTTELSKYTYNLLSETPDYWVVERTPVYGYSGYSKQVTHVDKSNYQTSYIEFYDAKGDMLKTLTLSEWNKYENRFWRPKHFEMVNLQNKKKTILQLSDYVFGAADGGEFNSFNLSRVSNDTLRRF
ncbi:MULTISPECIES: outer membrane lipoprotein-sorting protein [unclassified Hahella]|uniref:outer membrane lipoprotein-sorting protein n=1 Tax=unclassified Hahella TaxID=2624107 RepID=UPI000FDDEF5D|nr:MULTISPECIES: outer membrane lipoprotein-sorting protein [unclassified Hahella]AZZ91757.1 outer membrane lipoprotein-sorting protein [Hahella sp. KA22]MBU6950858.1 outer membrane lipoprotein-sorting protein [Hahella sp. HN01]MDG9667248.1 outer membrane lipoprotein-sorting protein [Hahella sp. CR1]QAY55127.1 outer membrane lipoprotein-sorting protein [Hahella sp. KA22]